MVTRITNNTNGYQYDFRSVFPIKGKIVQPPIKIPLVQVADGQRPLMFRFIGQAEDYSFTFLIFDNGQDTSNGNPGGIITVEQQISHLMNDLFGGDFDGDFTLVLSDYYSKNINGVISNLEIDPQKGTGFAVGTLTFEVGLVVGA